MVSILRWKRFYLPLLVLVACCFLSFSGEAAGAKRDLDFKNTDLHDVLRALAELEQVNLLIDPGVQGRVNIHLQQVTFEQVLKILGEEYGFMVKQENNLYKILPNLEYGIELKKEGEMYTAILQDAALGSVLRRISEDSKVNIIFPSSAQERITIALYNVDLPTLLGVIAERAEYNMKKEHNYYVFTKKTSPAEHFYMQWEEGLLSLDSSNADLKEVARELTERTGVSILTDNDLQSRVTAFFKSLPLQTGLHILCSTNNLSLISEGEKVYRITKGMGRTHILYKDGLLSVEVNNTDITRVLEEISRQCGINILYEQEVRGAITLRFQELPLETGLYTLLEANNFSLEKRTGHYFVRRSRSQPNMRIDFDQESKLFYLEMTNAPLAQALSEIAQKAGENIIIFNHVNYSVNNLIVRDVTLEEAFDFLLKGTPFTYKKTDGVYLIGDGTNLRPETVELIESRLYTLEYTNVEYVFNSLPPSFPRGNIVLFKEQNALLVSAAPALHQLFAGYLETVDRPENQLKTELIRLSHLKAEEALKLFPPSLPKNDILVIKEANALAVTGTTVQINRVQRYLQVIDVANPLILFDVMVVQINRSKDRSLGLTYSTDAENVKEKIVFDGDLIADLLIPGSSATTKIKAGLQAKVKNGTAKLLANPQITTLNGCAADFNCISNYPRTIEVTSSITNADGEPLTEKKLVEVKTGIQMKLVPWISASNEITLEISPKFTQTIGGIDPTESTDLPATSESSTQSTIRVRNGDTIVISGLVQTRNSIEERKVPILGEIPLLGLLFKSKSVMKEETEFVIVITPHLLSGADQGEGGETGDSEPDVLQKYSEELRENVQISVAQ